MPKKKVVSDEQEPVTVNAPSRLTNVNVYCAENSIKREYVAGFKAWLRIHGKKEFQTDADFGVLFSRYLNGG